MNWFLKLLSQNLCQIFNLANLEPRLGVEGFLQFDSQIISLHNSNLFMNAAITVFVLAYLQILKFQPQILLVMVCQPLMDTKSVKVLVANTQSILDIHKYFASNAHSKASLPPIVFITGYICLRTLPFQLLFLIDFILFLIKVSNFDLRPRNSLLLYLK